MVAGFSEVTPGPTSTRRPRPHGRGWPGRCLRVGARPGELVRVADAGGLDLDQDLAFARAFQIQFDDFSTLNGLPASNATAARVFIRAAASLGPDWDIEVLETHHNKKVDAPSGTALMLGEAAAEGRGGTLDQLRTGPYDGPDAAREPGKIGFSVRRMGGVIGEHSVSFGSDTEIVTLSHTSLDRSMFAEGALKAAFWAINQKSGLYSMDDVLGLSGNGA
jgi:hypothetical protein